jgi:hypothetical protein
MQPPLPMMITPISGQSDTFSQIMSTLFLNAAQVASVKADLSVILIIDEDSKEYY